MHKVTWDVPNSNNKLEDAYTHSQWQIYFLHHDTVFSWNSILEVQHLLQTPVASRPLMPASWGYLLCIFVFWASFAVWPESWSFEPCHPAGRLEGILGTVRISTFFCCCCGDCSLKTLVDKTGIWPRGPSTASSIRRLLCPKHLLSPSVSVVLVYRKYFRRCQINIETLNVSGSLMLCV